jgi:hypothetical protein
MTDSKISRRQFTIASSAFLLSPSLVFSKNQDFPTVRIDKAQRKFSDALVEKTIERIKAKCADKEIAWLFENCFPNTLDTTVSHSLKEGVLDK